MGTGELKLMAMCRFATDELHELVSLKYEELGPVDAGGLVHQAFDAAGEITPTFTSLVERLCAGLATLTEPSWQRVTFTRCFIGATDWFRSLAETDVALSTRLMDALVHRLSAKLAELGMGFVAEWGVVEGTDEARYAMRRDEREIPVAVIAGGSGSVQLTGLDHFQSFQMPVKKGMETVKAATSRAAGLATWRDQVDAQIGESSLIELLRTKAQQLQESPELAPPGGETIRICLISSFYHTAVHAKIISRGAPYVYQPMPELCEKLKAFEADTDTDANPKLLREVVNAMRLRCILERLVDPMYEGKVECLFARDWEFKASAGQEGLCKFRVTWTAGWWLDYLVELYKQDHVGADATAAPGHAVGNARLTPGPAPAAQLAAVGALAQPPEPAPRQPDNSIDWYQQLKDCITGTVVARHPRPLEQIAHLLLDDGLQRRLAMPTAQYVAEHNLEHMIEKVLDASGLRNNQHMPDALRHLSAEFRKIAARGEHRPLAY